jgi:hypothetical protein
MIKACKRVIENEGNPGIDGMTTEELPGWVQRNLERLSVNLLEGSYRPRSIRLALDRTNWKFGITYFNVLVLAIVYQGIAIPILYKVMPKFSNSSTAERIDLMQRYIELFVIDTIECLLADREFVGDHWLAYLNNKRIRYYVRIRKYFWIDIPKNGYHVKASWFFSHLSSTSMSSTMGLFISGASFVIYLPQKSITKIISLNFR